jgi:orotate phosphoribosyltransferase
MGATTDFEGPKELIARATSLLLLDTEAVRISLNAPFRLASGNFSPVYINCRRIISDPLAMDLITSFAHWICQLEGIEFDVVAGGESAGIPFASFLAHRLAKSMIYVRKKSKDHGISSLIEGKLVSLSRVLLVEDLITDGKSKIDFLKPIRDEGATIENCLVIFDRLQGGSDFLSNHGVHLLSLTDIRQTLLCAERGNRLGPNEIREIEGYLTDTQGWHESRGLAFQAG